MKNNEVQISTKTILRVLIIIIFAAILVWAVIAARWAIVMILTAIFLALVLNRPVEFFARKLPKKSRALGSAIVFAIVLAVAIGAITLVIPVLIEQTVNFAKALPDTFASLQESSIPINNFLVEAGLEEPLNAMVNSFSNSIGDFASNIGSASVSLVGGVINGIGSAVIILILTFFMLVEGPTWVNKLWVIAVKDPKKRDRYRSIGDKMYTVLTGYVSSQLIAAAITGVLAGIGVFILSLFMAVPTSLILPITAIVFVAAFIPFFGGFIGAAIGTILVLLFNPLAALIFVIYCAIMMVLFYNIFSPKITGRFMKISALLVLISLIIGMEIAGVFGALVSIPVAGCLVVLLREHLKYREAKKQLKSD